VRRWLLAGLFVALLVAFAVALWGTIVRPPAYEVRGVLIARPTPELIIVRHEAIGALGMAPMETMAVHGEARMIDFAGIRPGDPLRLAVKARDGELVLLRVQKLR
jgi:hypothetical protein